MYEDDNYITLTELIDMKRLGIMTKNDIQLQDSDMEAVLWMKNHIMELLGKPHYRTKIGFTIQPTKKTVSLALIVKNGWVSEFRWCGKSILEVLKVWSGRIPANLTVIDVGLMGEGQDIDPGVEEFKYYIVENKVIFHTHKGSVIMKILEDNTNTLNYLDAQDMVNLLYTLQELKESGKA